MATEKAAASELMGNKNYYGYLEIRFIFYDNDAILYKLTVGNMMAFSKPAKIRSPF